MFYKFADIENESIITKSNVLVIGGSYPFFNHMVIDKCSSLCKGEITFDLSLFDEFNINTEADSLDYLDFDSFMTYVRGRKLVGKWYCSVNYKGLSKKQLEVFTNYIKRPSENGLLVVTVDDWKDLRLLSKNKILERSQVANLLDLSWPNRKTLVSVLSEYFLSKGVQVEVNALNLFILRMGNQYNDYKDQIDTICLGNKGKQVSYTMMLSYLDGIINYAVDDFIMAIIKPIKNDKIVTSRKAYKILNTLVDDLGAKSLVRQLKRRVNLYVEYRTYINDGVIPILVNYSVEAVQTTLPDSSLIKKTSDVAFKRGAKIANLTSLKDWYYIKLILDSASRSTSEEDNLRSLMAVIHRGIYNQDRLMNVLGLKDVLDEGLYDLNIRKMGEDIEDEEQVD